MKAYKSNTIKKKDEVIEIYESKQGNITETAKASNISRVTFYQWLKDDKKFKESIENINDSLLDFAESQLRLLMKGIPKTDTEGELVDWVVRPDNTSIIFFLKTKGKKRGYIERQEFDHNPDKSEWDIGDKKFSFS